jgi:hypothetical protein
MPVEFRHFSESGNPEAYTPARRAAVFELARGVFARHSMVGMRLKSSCAA